MFKRIMLTLSSVLLLCGFALAQKTVTGTIVANKEPLVGASVVVKGTTIGAITDIDGKYSVTLPSGADV